MRHVGIARKNSGPATRGLTRKAQRLGGAGLLAATVLAFASAPASACKCRCDDGVEAFLERVPVLFRGRPTAEATDGEERRYTFDVVAVHKGVVAARATVRTPLDSAACGVTYPIGREVLVGAYPEAGGLSVNLCTQYCLDQHRGAIDRLLAR